MKALLCAAAAAACLVATPAAAQLYGAVGLTHLDAEAGDIPELGTMGFETITGRVGFGFNRYVAVEGEASFGWEDATTTFTETVTDEDDEEIEVDVSVNTSLKHDIAAFLVGRLPMTDNASLVGRVGYGQTEYEFETTAVADGESETETIEGNAEGWRYGVGAEFFFNDMSGVRIDFTRQNTSEVDADSYTISYVHRFG